MQNLNANLNLAWDLWQLLLDYLLRTRSGQSQLEQVSQGHVQLGFEYQQWWEVTSSLGNLCQCLTTLTGRGKKRMSEFMVERDLMCFHLCPLPLVWRALRRVGLHLLYPFPHIRYIYTLMSSSLSCLFLRLYSPGSQFLLVWQTVHSLHHLLAHPLVSLQ